MGAAVRVCVGGRVRWRGGWLVTAAVERVDLTCQLWLGQVRGRRLGGRRENLSCLGTREQEAGDQVTGTARGSSQQQGRPSAQVPSSPLIIAPHCLAIGICPGLILRGGSCTV